MPQRRPPRYSTVELRSSLLADPDSQTLMGLRRGARDLLGMDASLDAIYARLRRYALSEVLETLGRMDAVLRDAGPRSASTQGVLLNAIFAPERVAAMVPRLHRAMRQDEAESRGRAPNPPVIFEPRLLAAMAVLAGSVLPPDGPPTEAARDGLGEALLMLSDLMEGVLTPVGHDMDTSEGRRRWLHYFAVAAFALGADDTVHAVVRTVEIYLDAHDELREDPHYVDLAALFAEATGLPLDAYLLVAVALIGTLFRITAETAPTKHAFIGDDFFASFPPPLRERFLALVGDDATTFCEAARTAWPVGALRPFALLPVEQSPLVRFEPGAVCLSVRLLERRLTAGIYHVLLNARPGDEHRKFRQHLQQFIGRVFERYVERSMGRMVERLRARPGWHPRERRGHGPAYFVTEAAMLAAVGGATGKTPSVCDGALVVGQDVFLVETKARFFSLRARTGDAPDELFKRLREITVDGTRQLDATVEHLAAGRLRAVGLDDRRVRRIFPMVVSLEDLPITPEVRAWVDDEIASEGYLRRDTVGPASVYLPELLTARDLEWLELVIERTPERPGDLLARKQSRAFWHSISLVSWDSVANVLPDIPGPDHLSHHAARWEALMERVGPYLREHESARANAHANEPPAGTPPDEPSRDLPI